MPRPRPSLTRPVSGLVCSSDSSDSRLPIIRREEASTDEAYDETFVDERDFRSDQSILSSEMYCNYRQPVFPFPSLFF